MSMGWGGWVEKQEHNRLRRKILQMMSYQSVAQPVHKKIQRNIDIQVLKVDLISLGQVTLRQEMTKAHSHFAGFGLNKGHGDSLLLQY